MSTALRIRWPILAACLVSLSLSCGNSPTVPTGSLAQSAAACSGAAGVSCFGEHQYIEYIPGTLPLVISVPHGGALTPTSIPDRTTGTTVRDSNTIELGRAIASAFQERTGRTPHLVIVHLRRTKLDANREVVEAAQGNPEAVQAWTEYHAFIERAIAAVQQSAGTGFYVDLHGHGHPIHRLELGYLLSADVLNDSDAALDASGAIATSSLRVLAGTSPLTASALLRGPTSLGGLLAPSVASVPSPAAPGPGEAPYFNGGYSTVQHTTAIPGVQIESHFEGVRDTADNRATFAGILVGALTAFSKTHLGLTF